MDRAKVDARVAANAAGVSAVVVAEGIVSVVLAIVMESVVLSAARSRVVATIGWMRCGRGLRRVVRVRRRERMR